MAALLLTASGVGVVSSQEPAKEAKLPAIVTDNKNTLIKQHREKLTVTASAAGESVGVWSVNDSGNARARFKIGQGVLLEMRALAVDPKNKSVIITDKELNAVMTWYVPEVFAQAAAAKSN